MITLPKSGKTIEIEKGVSAKLIKRLDQYLSKHSISNEPASVSPDLQNCTEHSSTYWETENQYRSVSGKYLGIGFISYNTVSWRKLHNQYGFTNILVTIPQIDSALSARFNEDSIMINLGYNATGTDIQSHPAKYYFIDEPYEHGEMSSVAVDGEWISIYHPDAKLLFTDYYWPDGSTCLFSGADGPEIKNYLYSPNTYIMCDEYGHCGSLCGNTHDYWNEYKGYYGLPNKNLTNLITLWIEASGDWGDLLNVATAWSTYGAMNPIWIYAGDTPAQSWPNCNPSHNADYVDENRIASFCSTAWEKGWLLRQEKQVETLWYCDTDNPSPCAGCSWPNVGTWYVFESFYTGQVRYVIY